MLEPATIAKPGGVAAASVWPLATALVALLTVYGEIPDIGPISSLLYYLVDGEWQLVHASYAVLAGLAAFATAAWISGGWAGVRFPRVVLLCWLPYAIWSMASISWSRFPEYSLLEWSTEVFMPLGCMVLVFVVARDHVHVAKVYGKAAVVLLSLLGPLIVAGFFMNERYPLDIVLFGTWLSFLLPFILVWFAEVFDAKAGWKQPAWVLLIYLILCALLMSRMLWLVLASVTLLALGGFRIQRLEPRHSGQWMSFLILLAVACVCAFILTANARPANATAATISQEGWWRLFISSERYEIFSFWFQQVKKELLTGVGLGFELPSLAYRKFRPFYFEPWDTYATHGHNLLMNRALQGGVVGLIFYLLGLSSFVVAALRSKALSISAKRTRWCLFAVLYILMAKNFSDDGMRDGTIVWFWLLMGVLLGHMEHIEKPQLRRQTGL